MIISFAYTVDALLSGKKSVTRRKWTPRYHLTWVKAWREGRRIHQAWDKSPRCGGHHIADIRLTYVPYQEVLRDMPWTDLELEGTGHKRVSDFVAAFFDNEYERVSVIRFEVIPLAASG